MKRALLYLGKGEETTRPNTLKDEEGPRLKGATRGVRNEEKSCLRKTGGSTRDRKKKKKEVTGHHAKETSVEDSAKGVHPGKEHARILGEERSYNHHPRKSRNRNDL